MPKRPNGVRVVQVSHDGSLLNYHGLSEQEAAERLFDTSERPLSSLAERLLETLAHDTHRTQGPGAARSNSRWWNGQLVEEETRNSAFAGPNSTSTPQKPQETRNFAFAIAAPNSTSTPQKPPHQGVDLPQPMRPSKVTTVNNYFEVAEVNQENPTITGATANDLQRPPLQHHVSSTRTSPQVQQRLEPSEPRQGVAGGAFALQHQADSAWLTHSSWTDVPGLRTRSQVETRPPSPSFDVTLDGDLMMEEDQIMSEQQPMMRPASNQGADSMMMGNFSPPSNLLSQFVSQDVEEEVDESSWSPKVDNVRHPRRPVALPLPVPKRKPTFSAPFKPNKGTAPPPPKSTRM